MKWPWVSRGKYEAAEDRVTELTWVLNEAARRHPDVRAALIDIKERLDYPAANKRGRDVLFRVLTHLLTQTDASPPQGRSCGPIAHCGQEHLGHFCGVCGQRIRDVMEDSPLDGKVRAALERLMLDYVEKTDG